MQANSADSVIAIEDISKVFEDNGKRVQALDRVSFSVANSEFVSIIGPSGSGKTTLFRIIAGLESPTAGEI
ncbi:MAG: ATP-binding cassette domain-containing protein, partial [Halobacteriaceae archaeon]